MSAILKALRRIEQESGSEVQVRSLPRTLDTKKVISHRAKKDRLFRRLASLLTIVSVLIAGLVLAVSYGPFFSMETVPLPDVTLSTQDPSDTKGRIEPRQDQVREMMRPTAQAGRAAVETWGVSSPTPGGKVPSGRDVKALPSERVAEAPGPSNEIRSRAESDPLLELQAIVWSDDPTSCFAVINGRIVRSGGMVDGIAVGEIGKESVSLRLGDRTWTIRMLQGD